MEHGRINFDNPVWIFMGKLADMVVLGGLWLLCSLPVVTAGASTAALYYVILKLAKDQEGYIVSSFFRSFRENLKQGTAVSFIAIGSAAILAGDFYLVFQMKNDLGVLLFWVFAVITAVCLIVLVHIFPLMARCDTDLKHLAAMAFVIGVKNFGWTLFMLASIALFVTAGIFWMAPLLVVVPGGCAYLHAKILHVVWRGYGLELE